MIPYSINMNNMIAIKVSEAEVKPIDPKFFSYPDKVSSTNKATGKSGDKKKSKKN
jgi:hypothetical protein